MKRKASKVILFCFKRNYLFYYLARLLFVIYYWESLNLFEKFTFCKNKISIDRYLCFSMFEYLIHKLLRDSWHSVLASKLTHTLIGVSQQKEGLFIVLKAFYKIQVSLLWNT